MQTYELLALDDTILPQFRGNLHPIQDILHPAMVSLQFQFELKLTILKVEAFLFVVNDLNEEAKDWVDDGTAFLPDDEAVPRTLALQR